MRRNLMLFVYVLVFFILLSCSSKEMRDAKDFIALKDWDNALEKLQLEIKNHPKNVDAYQLIYDVKFNKFFPTYSDSNFANPRTAENDMFPELNQTAIDELLITYEKIKKLAPDKINPKNIFFLALYHYYEWDRSINYLVESEEDILKSWDLYDKLREQKCDNEIYLSALDKFKICSNMKSDIADNAYYWWFTLQCDSTFTDSMFVSKFNEKYKKSDLVDYIDLITFRKNISNYLDNIKNKPDSISAKKSIDLTMKFIEEHPGFSPKTNDFSNLIISYVVNANREYMSYDVGYQYTNSKGLLDYLNQFTKQDIPINLKIDALSEIAEYYDITSKKDKAISIYKDILNYDLDEEKKDEINYKIGEYYEKSSQYKDAIVFYENINNITDMQKYNLWNCYNKIGDYSNADILRDELENSDDSMVSYLVALSSQIDDLTKLEISGLDAEFDDYSINVTGYVNNNLRSTVYNVKVRAEVSDKYGNNTKQSFDYIDVIYPNKKSRFEISLYYGSNVPYSIKYGARVVDYTK